MSKEQGTVERWKTDKGWLYVKEDNCKGCNYCIEFCPREVLEESERFNDKGYHPPEPVHIEDCVNCGFCDLICPDFAIWSEKVDSDE